jgi:hypothetical protein
MVKFRAEAMPGIDHSTRATYELAFEAIDRKFGRAPLAAFVDPRIRADVKAWHRTFAQTPRAADMRLGSLVRLLNFAVDEGLIASHACNGIERLHEVDRSHVIWTSEELEAYAADAPFGLWLGLQLLRYSGLRRGDAVSIQLSADKGDRLEWNTSKSGGRAEVVIPVVKPLRTALDAAKRYRLEQRVAATTILFNSRGLPWTPMGFSASFDKRKEALGIRKRIHDLRGTAATEFMQVGMSDEEVAEIMGWRSDDVRAIRRRYVTRSAIVSAAIARLERNDR